MDSDQERICGLGESALEADLEGRRNKQADVSGSAGKEHNENEDGGSRR